MFESAIKGWSIAALSLSIMFLSTFVLASYMVPAPSKQTTRVTAQEAARDLSTTLSIDPKEASVKEKTQKTLSVNVNTGKDKVAALELHLSFNPKLVKIDSIAPGAFFEKANVLHKEIDNKAGTVVFVFGSIEPKTGNGEAATFRITTLSAGNAEVNLSSGTEVAALGKTYNVVKSMSGAVLTVTR